jgi:hypothetical protein
MWQSHFYRVLTAGPVFGHRNTRWDAQFRNLSDGNFAELWASLNHRTCAAPLQVDGMLLPCVACAGVALSQDATDLLAAMLHPQPGNRITLADIVTHPWMTAATPYNTGNVGDALRRLWEAAETRDNPAKIPDESDQGGSAPRSFWRNRSFGDDDDDDVDKGASEGDLGPRNSGELVDIATQVWFLVFPTGPTGPTT